MNASNGVTRLAVITATLFLRPLSATGESGTSSLISRRLTAANSYTATVGCDLFTRTGVDWIDRYPWIVEAGENRSPYWARFSFNPYWARFSFNPNWARFSFNPTVQAQACHRHGYCPNSEATVLMGVFHFLIASVFNFEQPWPRKRRMMIFSGSGHLTRTSRAG